jgi:tRNA (mo5U34)-methyltransferase
LIQDTQPDSIREARRRQDHSQALADKGWYHSFALPDGTRIDGVNPLEYLQQRYVRFPIPDDLRGKRVLDVGAWDGWFSFEAERHGAAVTAIDCVEQEHFLDLRRKFASTVDYRMLEVYELPEAGIGKFDIVFFLGVLYHLRHPLRALEIICGMSSDIAIVESFVTDGATWQEHPADIPSMEFYENHELGGQFDNWVGPSVSCLLALCRAAGFARVELLSTEPYNAVVACYRKWEPPDANPASNPPELGAVTNNAGLGINFSSRKEQYMSCWFESSRPAVSTEDLRLEVDQFGVRAYYVGRMPDGFWLANFALPPGLTPGWKPVRLRFADSGFGKTLRIAVDLPLVVSRLECVGIYDPVTWKRDEIRMTDKGYVTCWVSGLPENCDRNNVRVLLGDTRLPIYWLGTPDAAGCVQINATVSPAFPKGEHALRIECGGVSSAAQPVRVT